MRLSVQVSKPKGNVVFACKGQIVEGPESQYLFDILSRPDRGNVIVDLQRVTAYDETGASVLVLCRKLLGACHRKLLVRNAPGSILELLKGSHGLKRKSTDFAAATRELVQQN